MKKQQDLLATRTKQCRYGTFTYFVNDEFVGRALDLYGEYSEFEVTALRKVLKPGATVLNIGANIGTLAVPISQMVGETGTVLAFEPNPDNYDLLCANLEQNDCLNVEPLLAAVSSKDGMVQVQRLEELGHNNFGRVEVGEGSSMVRCLKIDSLNLKKCHLLCIDVEGHEREVIRGAVETIKKFRPLIFVENDREHKSVDLIAEIFDLGYYGYWFRPSLFNPDNFAHEERNLYPDIVSQNMLCFPNELKVQVDGCDEVADIRDDDEMFTRARDRFMTLVERDPTDLNSRLMIAHYSNLMQDIKTADAMIAENLRRDPDHLPSRAISGLLGLQRGNWKENWPLYELRFRQKQTMAFGGHRWNHFKVPEWDGQPTHKPVLIWAEQGFGDQIMFARFFKHALERAPQAFLEATPELHELFESSGISPNGVYRMYRSMPDYAYHCSLCSLPARLGADEAMMRITRPYLFPDRGLVQHWHSRHNPRIGICHSGSFKSERPYTRDCPMEVLEPLLFKHGPVLTLVQHGQYQSFSDTAAAIANLDLVISVDTSVAHLAGAMGVPTWLLLSYDPDWRWGLEDSTTPWYPTMRIFRQPKFRDWQSVIEQLDAALEERSQLAA